MVVQDAGTSQVLMLAWMNREALELTEKTGKATFFSRSRNKIWVKGETSGNWLNVVSLSADCDADTILMKAEPAGPVCHTGNDTCFGEGKVNDLWFLRKLDGIIADRKRELPENSYTTSLFQAGVEKIARKVGEEAVELIIEALAERESEFMDEAADLLYHLMVLLRQRDRSISDLLTVLERRHG